jgi:hypothetical protein
MTHRQLGPQERFPGYVTTLASISGRTADQLELALGLGAGSLAAGFYVFALAEPVGLGDFEWKDRTTYSDGWHFDSSIGEYVQRRDELRAHLGKLHSYNEASTDRKIRELMEVQLKRLNVRVGPQRIIKVLSKGRVATFPDSPHRNVPQWKLVVPKLFTRVADVGPGQRFTSA